MLEKKGYCYYLDGEKLPSVTTILGVLDKPAILYWSIKKTIGYIGAHLADLRAEDLTEDEALDILKKAKQHAFDIAKQEADRGTQVHTLIHQYLLGEKVYLEELDEKVRNGYQGAENWIKESGYTSEAIEEQVYHKDLLYAGTLDTRGKRADKRALLDWKATEVWKERKDKKTGEIKKYFTEQPYAEMKIQPVAYAEAVGNIDEVWVIRLDKSTGIPYPYLIEKDEREACFQSFLGALQTYKALKGIVQNKY
ncbi:MAG: hypothetical protein PHF74_05720 [Dehalococcoidales bacterium]|nr:hypothetical protein [Dehalococcoidales bacterium]